MWLFAILSLTLMTGGVACRWIAGYVPSPSDAPGRADAFLNDGVSCDGHEGEPEGGGDTAGDEAGRDRSGSVDGARDGWLGSEDLPLTADTLPETADVASALADTGPVADAKLATPFDEAAFLAALKTKKVACVKADGTRDGTMQALLDSNLLRFVDWSTVSGSVPVGPTTSWIGSASAVLLIWDLNACDNEDGAGRDWQSAAILIRGATRIQGGDVLLSATTTMSDMNLVNVEASGAWQGEMYGVNDALPPNLVEPINGVKSLILQMAGLP